MRPTCFSDLCFEPLPYLASRFRNFSKLFGGGVRHGQLRHPAEARRSVVGLPPHRQIPNVRRKLSPAFRRGFFCGALCNQPAARPLMRRACWSPSRNGNLCDGKHQVAGKPTLPPP